LIREGQNETELNPAAPYENLIDAAIL